MTAPTVTATPADASTATVTSETDTGTDTGTTICDDEKHTICLSDTILPYRRKNARLDILYSSLGVASPDFWNQLHTSLRILHPNFSSLS